MDMDFLPDERPMEPVAVVRTDFPSKFGLRARAGWFLRSGERSCSRPSIAIRTRCAASRAIPTCGWCGSSPRAHAGTGRPRVRPPRLGGNTAMGVFATRSPFRPNPIGLSCVRAGFGGVRHGRGTLLHISGIDMMDGTPVYDIKPYVPHAALPSRGRGRLCRRRARLCASGGRARGVHGADPADRREALIGVLAQDPRPGYRPRRRAAVWQSGSRAWTCASP